jgi:hypothetical protein
VFFCVSVEVMPVLLGVRNACSMSDSSMVLTVHSTMWWMEPSRQTRPRRTLDLPCWCRARVDWDIAGGDARDESCSGVGCGSSGGMRQRRRCSTYKSSRKWCTNKLSRDQARHHHARVARDVKLVTLSVGHGARHRRDTAARGPGGPSGVTDG